MMMMMMLRLLLLRCCCCCCELHDGISWRTCCYCVVQINFECDLDGSIFHSLIGGPTVETIFLMLLPSGHGRLLAHGVFDEARRTICERVLCWRPDGFTRGRFRYKVDPISAVLAWEYKKKRRVETVSKPILRFCFS
jgi:hypothetical protein